MQELITQSLNTLKDLSRFTQALLILAVLAGFTVYGYLEYKKPAEEAPATVNKEATLGDINGNVGGGINLSQ